MERIKINKIYDAVKKVNRAYEIWAAKHGLTLYEMQIYYVIVENGGGAITQKDLCTQLDAPKTSINSIIKKQLKTNRIEMSVNPLNKREKVITLTKEGEKFANNLVLPLFEYENEIVSKIDEKELEIAVKVENDFANGLIEKVNDE
ncbi:MAG: hypothetical protein SOY48_03335 [Eubacterium sp.]|nr:hypothetical protein [Eubacterium sp.]MDD6567737.1 hypothetical protein [Eubacteriales bacterium]MDY4109908.1 hypothetical protein [Eubacterium sp.]